MGHNRGNHSIIERFARHECFDTFIGLGIVHLERDVEDGVRERRYNDKGEHTLQVLSLEAVMKQFLS